MISYWLIKSEPATYSFADLKRDKITVWDQVRNFLARNNLKKMLVGDICLFYHSGKEKQILGTAKVVKSAYREHTTDIGEWFCVDVAYHKTFKNTLPLSQIKNHSELKNMVFVRQSRLSVSPVLTTEWLCIERLT